MNSTKTQSVLVIEDDNMLRTLLVKKLEDASFLTLQATNAVEALKIIREQHPAVVLLDIILPSTLDGFDLLKQVKADKGIATIPVVVLSNLGTQEDIQRAMGLGAVDYMIKAHVTPDDVVVRVQRLFSAKEAPGTS